MRTYPEPGYQHACYGGSDGSHLSYSVPRDPVDRLLEIKWNLTWLYMNVDGKLRLGCMRHCSGHVVSNGAVPFSGLRGKVVCTDQAH